MTSSAEGIVALLAGFAFFYVYHLIITNTTIPQSDVYRARLLEYDCVCVICTDGDIDQAWQCMKIMQQLNHVMDYIWEGEAWAARDQSLVDRRDPRLWDQIVRRLACEAFGWRRLRSAWKPMRRGEDPIEYRRHMTYWLYLSAGFLSIMAEAHRNGRGIILESDVRAAVSDWEEWHQMLDEAEQMGHRVPLNRVARPRFGISDTQRAGR